jgi:hypothetical protein
MLVHPIHVEYPEWTMIHESDKAMSVRNRKRLLQQAAAQGCLVHCFHMIFPGLGRITTDPRGWKWQPW